MLIKSGVHTSSFSNSVNNVLARRVDQMLGTSSDIRLLVTIGRTLYSSASDEWRAVARLHEQIKQFEKNPSTACDQVRTFMDSLVAHYEKTRIGDLMAVDDPVRSRLESPIDRALRLQTSIQQAVELCVMGPIHSRLEALVRKICAPKDAITCKKRELLRNRPQTFFGVASVDVSDDNWSAAVCELSVIEAQPTPFERLHCLLDAARAIYTNYSAQRNMKLYAEYEKERIKPVQARWGSVAEFIPKQQVLAADEFFPIFVYVVVNAEIRHPEAVLYSMSNLCAKSHLQGEGGYYLTVFEAALEYISGFDMEQHILRQEQEANRLAMKKQGKKKPHNQLNVQQPEG